MRETTLRELGRRALLWTTTCLSSAVDLPLFIMIRYAHRRAQWSDKFNGVKHSPILCYQRLRELEMSFSFYRWELPSGTEAIDDIVARLSRERPIRECKAAEIRSRFAHRIYNYSTSLSNYLRLNCQTPKCGEGGLLFKGRMTFTRHRCIKISEAPKARCKWCQIQFFPKFTPKEGRPVFCGSWACRYLNHFAYKYRSQGGVDITPTQRRQVPYINHDTQRVVNLLQRIAHDKAKRNKSGRALKRGAAGSAV